MSRAREQSVEQTPGKADSDDDVCRLKLDRKGIPKNKT